ncbi:MAG: hypothetical protein RIQ72_505 [Candidatus Parcubacteria bacterium]|jgi:hypothetical protein
MKHIIQRLKSGDLYKIRVIIESFLERTVGLLAFQYQKRDNLFNWFYSTLKEQHVSNANHYPRFNYYEFGVASGGSIRVYILALQKFCKDFDQDISQFKVFGFDSFQGLPEPQEGDERKDWRKGAMSCNKNDVLSVIAEVGFPIENVRLIEGYFDDSLTPELQRELKDNPPAIVNMDADYYSSTKTVFDWLLPFAASGTMFRFDDMWAFHGHKEMGVVKAIEEVNHNGVHGWLTPFPSLGLPGYIYVFARKEFRYIDKSSQL